MITVAIHIDRRCCEDNERNAVVDDTRRLRGFNV